MNKLTIEDLALAGKRVLVRVDFNVPLRDGEVADDRRIRAALPTICHALDHGAAVIVMSHLGRPKGEVRAELSLAPVARALEKHLGRPVGFATDGVTSDTEAAAEQSACGVAQVDSLLNAPGTSISGRERSSRTAMAAPEPAR